MLCGAASQTPSCNKYIECLYNKWNIPLYHINICVTKQHHLIKVSVLLFSEPIFWQINDLGIIRYFKLLIVFSQFNMNIPNHYLCFRSAVLKKFIFCIIVDFFLAFRICWHFVRTLMNTWKQIVFVLTRLNHIVFVYGYGILRTIY